MCGVALSVAADVGGGWVIVVGIMSKGFPTYSAAARSGDRGVEVVSRVINETFGWLFRRNHQEHDFGIDAQVDVVLDDGAVTGQMLALQIKHGSSFFNEKNQWGYVFRGEQKHFNYLANYPTPVLIVLSHPASDDCYWVVFDPSDTSRAGANWKITVPFENKLAESKARIVALLPRPKDYLSEVQSYWEENDILANQDQFLFVIGREQISSLDVSDARAFFDRLLISKTLAAHCQGKVEIGFHGYDSDPRELFEIPQMRRFVPLLVDALPELFFFAYTGDHAQTLKTLALCLTEVKRTPVVGYGKDKIPVEVSTDKIGQFLESHFRGLNGVSEWLKFPEADIKRISFDVVRSMGLETPPDYYKSEHESNENGVPAYPAL